MTATPAGGRIKARFEALARENRAGFVAYVMAGDPEPGTAMRILHGLPAAGADLIELAFPSPTPWPTARRSSAPPCAPWPPA